MKFLPTSYHHQDYRNIFTCAPTQYHFDDLVAHRYYNILQAWAEQTSAVYTQTPQLHRPLQYNQIDEEELLAVFKEHHWNQGRFSDGTSYGVWYSAEQALTSVYEAAWISFCLAQDNILASHEVYTSDRRMYSAQIKSKQGLDLT